MAPVVFCDVIIERKIVLDAEGVDDTRGAWPDIRVIGDLPASVTDSAHAQLPRADSLVNETSKH